jgi:transcriptional regulator with XRE-family HTH domain
MGLTQAELAAKLDTSQDTVSKWETGRRSARPGTAKRIADTLGVTVQELSEPPVGVAYGPKVGASELARLPESARRTLIRLIAAKDSPHMYWTVSDIIGVREDFRQIGVSPEDFAAWFETARVADVAMFLRPMPDDPQPRHDADPLEQLGISLEGLNEAQTTSVRTAVRTLA